MATVIDMGLTNKQLYAGCEIGEVGGRQTLMTKPVDAANIIGRNAKAIVDAVPAAERDRVTLTGAMAVWAYLIVEHVVLHMFGELWYDDGKGNTVLIAKH